MIELRKTIFPYSNIAKNKIFSRNYVQVRRNYGRQPSNQLRGAQGASAHACSTCWTGLSTGRRLMPMTALCGAAAPCRGASRGRAPDAGLPSKIDIRSLTGLHTTWCVLLLSILLQYNHAFLWGTLTLKAVGRGGKRR